MGKLDTDSFDDFLKSIKQAGVIISNEAELRERMAEAYSWRYAFRTMMANGRRVGICFEESNNSIDEAKIRRAFSRYQLPQGSERILAASLESAY